MAEERLVTGAMSEVTKAVGQWIVGNVGWSVLILLFVLSMFFKITKKEIDPLGWVIGWFGKALTRDVRKDVSDLKKSTDDKFEEIKKDRSDKVDELKKDYNDKIRGLRDDLDSFEKSTNKSIDEIKIGTAENCEKLKKRLDEMESASIRSNDMQTIRQIKAHVLDFANSCMNHRRHTKKEFENIIEENTTYEGLIKKYRIKNDVYAEDFKFVMDVYHQCQKEGSFLNESGSVV